MRSLRAIAGAGAVAGALIVSTAPPAAAHVTVTPDTTAAGSYATLSFANSHGCDGSPTTELAISIPESITTVTPTRSPYYDAEVVTVEVDETDEVGANARDAEVIFTATEPLPDGYRETVEISLLLPDEEGEQLSFPTVQSCQEGEIAWDDEVTPGEEEPEEPAPTFELTAAEDDRPGGAEPAAAPGAADASGPSGIAWAALGLSGLAVVGVGALVLRSRGTT